MNFNERIDIFLKLQEDGVGLDEIASQLGIKSTTLRRELNKNGYKSKKGKYIKIEKDDIDKEDINKDDIDINRKDKDKEKKDKDKKDLNTKKKTTKKDNINQKTTKTKKSKSDTLEASKKPSTKKSKVIKVQGDKKINITAQDLDKLCEVYDWYLQVKDLKSLKRKKSKREVIIDFEHTEYKSTNIKVDKKIWEDFLRLCSNTDHDKKELLSQALNDFMKIYKEMI